MHRSLTICTRKSIALNNPVDWKVSTKSLFFDNVFDSLFVVVIVLNHQQNEEEEEESRRSLRCILIIIIITSNRSGEKILGLMPIDSTTQRWALILMMIDGDEDG